MKSWEVACEGGFIQATNRIQGQFSEVLGNIPCVAVTADPFADIQRGYQLLRRNGNCNKSCEESGANLEHHCKDSPNIVTHTEVNLRELRSPLDLIDTK